MKKILLLVVVAVVMIACQSNKKNVEKFFGGYYLNVERLASDTDSESADQIVSAVQTSMDFRIQFDSDGNGSVNMTPVALPVLKTFIQTPAEAPNFTFGYNIQNDTILNILVEGLSTTLIIRKMDDNYQDIYFVQEDGTALPFRREQK